MPSLPVSCCTTAPLTPAWLTVSWTWVCDAEGAENWNTAPPLKSTLKFSPWTNSATMLMSRMAPEIAYHRRLWPTKS